STRTTLILMIVCFIVASLAGTTEADERPRVEWPAGADHREGTGRCTAAKIAASQQRTRSDLRRARPEEAHEVVTETSPAGARRRQRHPLRHPLVQVPDHVEGSPRRFAILPRAGGGPEHEPLLQFVVPLSGPASGVPVAPNCHSALVGKRLPALAHASCAW